MAVLYKVHVMYSNSELSSRKVKRASKIRHLSQRPREKQDFAFSMLGIEKSKACLQVVKSSLPPMLPSHPFPNWNELGSARIWLIFVLVDRESFKLHALTVSYQNLLSLICIIIV